RRLVRLLPPRLRAAQGRRRRGRQVRLQAGGVRPVPAGADGRRRLVRPAVGGDEGGVGPLLPQPRRLPSARVGVAGGGAAGGGGAGAGGGLQGRGGGGAAPAARGEGRGGKRPGSPDPRARGGRQPPESAATGG